MFKKIIKDFSGLTYLSNASHDETAPADIVERTQLKVTVSPLQFTEDRRHTFQPVRNHSTFKVFGTLCKRFKTTCSRFQVLHAPSLSGGQ